MNRRLKYASLVIGLMACLGIGYEAHCLLDNQPHEVSATMSSLGEVDFKDFTIQNISLNGDMVQGVVHNKTSNALTINHLQFLFFDGSGHLITTISPEYSLSLTSDGQTPFEGYMPYSHASQASNYEVIVDYK